MKSHLSAVQENAHVSVKSSTHKADYAPHNQTGTDITAPAAKSTVNQKRGIGVPIRHYGDKCGIKASIIEWEDGSKCLRITGNASAYELLTDPIPSHPD